jgi:hypothetical protein
VEHETLWVAQLHSLVSSAPRKCAVWLKHATPELGQVAQLPPVAAVAASAPQSTPMPPQACAPTAGAPMAVAAPMPVVPMAAAPAPPAASGGGAGCGAMQCLALMHAPSPVMMVAVHM